MTSALLLIASHVFGMGTPQDANKAPASTLLPYTMKLAPALDRNLYMVRDHRARLSDGRLPPDAALSDWLARREAFLCDMYNALGVPLPTDKELSRHAAFPPPPRLSKSELDDLIRRARETNARLRK